MDHRHSTGLFVLLSCGEPLEEDTRSVAELEAECAAIESAAECDDTPDGPDWQGGHRCMWSPVLRFASDADAAACTPVADAFACVLGQYQGAGCAAGPCTAPHYASVYGRRHADGTQEITRSCEYAAVGTFEPCAGQDLTACGCACDL